MHFMRSTRSLLRWKKINAPSSRSRAMSCRTRPTFVDSTYYPPGWDQQRLIEASSSELRALPSEQFDNMRNGMVEKMGKERFQEFLQWLIVGEGLKNPTKAVAEATARSSTPDLVKTLQRYRNQTWGFTICRCCSLADDAQWARVQAQIMKILLWQFDRLGETTGVAEARSNFKVIWEQRPDYKETTPEVIARDYGKDFSLTALSSGLETKPPFIFVVTESAMNSVLREFALDDFPGPVRANAPFLEVVSIITTDEEYEEEVRRKAEEEDENYPIRFKVAIETLLTNFFDVIATQTMSLEELGGHLKGNDIWFSIRNQFRENDI